VTLKKNVCIDLCIERRTHKQGTKSLLDKVVSVRASINRRMYTHTHTHTHTQVKRTEQL